MTPRHILFLSRVLRQIARVSKGARLRVYCKLFFEILFVGRPAALYYHVFSYVTVPSESRRAIGNWISRFYAPEGARLASRSPGSSMKNRIPGLDGVCAIAFLLVYVSHAGFEKLIPGGLGVTIFFF